MDNKTWPSKIYIATSINNHGSDQKEYTSNEEIDHSQSQQWREESVVAKFLHIVKTLVHQTTLKDHPTNMLKFDQHYYVDMIQSLVMIE
jgi:hypothetical protein